MEEKRFRLGNLFGMLTNKQLKQVLGGYGDDDGDEGPAGCFECKCSNDDIIYYRAHKADCEVVCKYIDEQVVGDEAC